MENRDPSPPARSLLSRIDHLVYAARDLDAAVSDLERRLGVRATPGGAHPGRATRNALIAIGPASYLEIVAIDPAQPAPPGVRWLGVDGADAPRLSTWAAKGSDLDRVVREAAARGVVLGTVGSGSRQRPDGVALRWRFTDPAHVVAGGIVPFFIDWGASPHPAAGAARGARLAGLRAEHPSPAEVEAPLRALDLDLPVTRGPRAALIANLETAAGLVEVR